MSGECNICGDEHVEAVCHELRANELELLNADLVAENTMLKKRLELASELIRHLEYCQECADYQPSDCSNGGRDLLEAWQKEKKCK